jgi:hypothetical protein
MADTYPSAEVLGIDLAPIQPEWLVRSVLIGIQLYHSTDRLQGPLKLPLRD